MQKLMFTGRMLVLSVTIVVIFLLGNLGWPNSLLLQEIRDGGCHLVAMTGVFSYGGRRPSQNVYLV